jgi:hypothetical protein
MRLTPFKARKVNNSVSVRVTMPRIKTCFFTVYLTPWKQDRAVVKGN